MNRPTNIIPARIKKLLLDRRTLLLVYILVAVVISIVKYSITPGQYTGYNNYVIFKNSFAHLAAGKDIYAPYYNECWDLFKYSPSFAVLMAPFHALPDIAGLILWSLLNALVLFWTIRSLPVITDRTKALMLLFVLPELVISLENAQSNALIAGLIVGAFAMLEKRNIVFAALLLTCSVYIKLFGLVAFAMFLFYPQKLKFIMWSILWAVLLFILPLLVVSPGQLAFLYGSWLHTLQQDHSVSAGLSVIGVFNAWLGISSVKLGILLAGAALLLLPLLRTARYTDFNFRVLFLASLLIWMVIFNHKAESPTYVIAVSGVAIWYFTRPFSWPATIFLFAVLILTSFSASDLFPRFIRSGFFVPYQVKAVPCIIAWLWVIMELIRSGQRQPIKSFELER